MSDATYIIIFFSLLILSRALIIFFHELGHATVGLILYKGSFDIYIGSYGDPNKGFHFRAGRLKFHCIYNPLAWDRGLCVPEQNTVSYKHQLLFTLGGPIGSLVLALLFLSLLLTGLDNILKVYSFLVFFYAFAHFLNNIIPKLKPIKLFNGKIIYNDGQQLKILFKEKENFGLSTRLAEFYNAREFEKVIDNYENRNNSATNPFVLRIAAHAYLMQKDYGTCLRTFEALEILEQLTADDYCNFALAHARLNNHTQAFLNYDKALHLSPLHFCALNNRGYSYNAVGEYHKAILDFNKAIQIDSKIAHAQVNKGFSEIKLGLLEEGLASIEGAILLDANNSYAYRNKGVYYSEKKDYNKALELFLTARRIDPDTDLINEYLKEAESLRNGEIK